MSNNNLNNKKIVITRPIERAESLAEIIRKYNGVPVIVPTLELALVKSVELFNISKNIEDYDWIIFTSPAGVKSFFEVYTKKKIPSKIAVIGVKTEEELIKHENSPDLIPDKFTAEGLLESFKNIELKGKKVALPRTLSARTVLPEGLEAYGATVDIAEAYTSAIPGNINDILKLSDGILNNDVDVITFTSPLTVKNLLTVIESEKPEDYEKVLQKLREEVTIASIGPITGNVLNQYDIPAVEPERYTVKDMIEALIESIN